MPSRADMDRPASVTAAILGVVLIGITIPYFAFGGGDGGSTEYAISWSQASAATANGPTSSKVEATVTNVLVSSVVVEFDPCNDNNVQGLYGDMVITFTVKEGTAVIGSETATCDDAGPFTFQVLAQPDVGSLSADSADAAVKGAFTEAAANKTATYSLEMSTARAGSTIPVTPPAGGPSFSATAKLEVQAWRATANAPDPEAPR